MGLGACRYCRGEDRALDLLRLSGFRITDYHFHDPLHHESESFNLHATELGVEVGFSCFTSFLLHNEKCHISRLL